MKKIYLFVCFLFVASFSLFSQTKDSIAAPEIAIPVFKLDIGATPFNPDSTYLYKFPFQNVGSAPLTLINVVSACPCISVSYPESPVPAGHIDTIIVRFTPTRPGRFTQRVAVISNAKENPLKQLYAKATFLKQSEIATSK